MQSSRGYFRGRRRSIGSRSSWDLKARNWFPAGGRWNSRLHAPFTLSTVLRVQPTRAWAWRGILAAEIPRKMPVEGQTTSVRSSILTVKDNRISKCANGSRMNTQQYWSAELVYWTLTFDRARRKRLHVLRQSVGSFVLYGDLDRSDGDARVVL